MPQKYRLRLSLRARVALGVALPIFIVLAFLSLFNYSREFQLFDRQARIDAVQLGDMMIHSLNHAMLTKEGEHLITSLGDVSQLENVQLIQLVGNSGKVLADSSGQFSERIYNIGNDECVACHQFSIEDRPRVIPLEQPVKGWRISAPVNNLPECHECHDPSLEHLGILLMDISLTGKQEHLLDDLQINLLISVISTVLVSVMNYFLIHRLVVRRIEGLRRPLAEYANGEFSTRVSANSVINDELCELADTFNQMADKLERHALQKEELHQLRERAIVDERERIARELHDGFAQVLGYVNTKVMAVRLLVRDKKLKEADQQLIHLENAARGLFLDVREAILGLKMAGRAQTSLYDALEEYIDGFTRLSGIPTIFEASIDIDNGMIPAENQLHLFRIVQEGLNNVRKHAMATKVWVGLSQSNNGFILEIRDDGVGFDIGLVEPGGSDRYGLLNIRERAEEIGAKFRIDTKIGEGTRIVVQLILNQVEKKL